uniref:COMM domain-containing protein 2-like n=1 Tax=Phallusia mammillata TaxID=59560 RepID=A0A6F9DAJ9_9ASCI|nr:COMM domain-containing protein 2-like [Phallusia mammillata]
MFLRLSPENLQHLEFLRDAEDHLVQEFGSISLQFLANGINRKIFKAAAQKLEVDVGIIERAVIGLMKLFSEASKNGLEGTDFYDSLIALEFSNTNAETLNKLYSDCSKDTRHILAQCAPSLPVYEDLEWRLDVRLATRSLHQQLTPNVLLKFHITDGEKSEMKVMQTDPMNLIHTTRVLEEALEELKSNHVRRIVRTIQ